MTLRTAQPCGCTQESIMGKKRKKLCEHGNLFEKERSSGKQPRKSLRQGKGFAASYDQRLKVRGLPCIGCGREASEFLAIDPAHLWPRGQGGCDHPDCVVPLCRLGDGSGCHRAFDNGGLDLLSKLADSEAWAKEMAHPIAEHGVNPVTLVRRLSGDEYEFVKASESPSRETVTR